MGVTNRQEVRYKGPGHASSTESLQIPPSTSQNSLLSASSAESIPRIVIRRHQKGHKSVTELQTLPRNAGRRRQRRFKAFAELSALIEEDEDIFLEEGIPHVSAFATIIDNPDYEHIWDHIIADDENKEFEFTSKQTSIIAKPKYAVTSYTNISFHIKMTFKMMRSIYELQKTEEEIIEFFKNTPEAEYIRRNKSSFQRLLIHGIAQYYFLKSTSFYTEDGQRTIKVINPCHFQDFGQARLYTIVENNHNCRV